MNCSKGCVGSADGSNLGDNPLLQNCKADAAVEDDSSECSKHIKPPRQDDRPKHSVAIGESLATTNTINRSHNSRKESCSILDQHGIFGGVDDATTVSVATNASLPSVSAAAAAAAAGVVRISESSAPNHNKRNRTTEESDSITFIKNNDGVPAQTTKAHNSKRAKVVFYTPPPNRPKELCKTWPSRLMQLTNANEDDEWLPVMERIASHPHEICIAGVNGGQTAFHAACVRYPPEHVIQELCRVAPVALVMQNYSGETPLLISAYSASEQVQEILLRANPKTAAIQDIYGDCPLHFAAREGATLELMQEMVRAAPETISMANARGVTPFWLLPRSYLETHDLSDLIGVDRECFKDEHNENEADYDGSAEVSVNEQEDDEDDDDDDEENYRGDWERLLLFLWYSYFNGETAPRRDFNLTALSRRRSDYNWVVAAAASTPSCPREILRFLCSMFRDNALKYNERGFTPLLLAIQATEMEEPKKWDESEDGFREVVESVEMELEGQNTLSPEEVALNEGDTDFLREAVLSPVERTQEEDQSVVDILLDWNPASISYPDKEGRLPIAHALLSGKSWKVVRRIIAACPKALEVQDQQSGLFMFQLAATHSPELDTVYCIIRSQPNFLLQAAS